MEIGLTQFVPESLEIVPESLEHLNIHEFGEAPVSFTAIGTD
jgi:hypothetical protein